MGQPRMAGTRNLKTRRNQESELSLQEKKIMKNKKKLTTIYPFATVLDCYLKVNYFKGHLRWEAGPNNFFFDFLNDIFSILTNNLHRRDYFSMMCLTRKNHSDSLL